MYKIWYNDVKPKYKEKAKLCFTDTDCFTVHVKSKDIYEDIAKDVEIRFDSSSDQLERTLP